MRFRTLTVPAAALALALTATPAHAQFGRIFGQDRGSYGNARQIAYDNGYREGMDHGQKAVRDRKPFDLERERDYRSGDEGYRGEYGNKDRYRQEFRRGFAEGYHAAYERYGYNGSYNGGYYPSDNGRAIPRDNGAYGYPNDGRVYGGVYGGQQPVYGGYGAYGQVAFNNGLNDGAQKGQEDARNGKSLDPTRQKWYRSANRNYNDNMGMSRAQYQDEYRRGFQQGYEQAYRNTRRW